MKKFLPAFLAALLLIVLGLPSADAQEFFPDDTGNCLECYRLCWPFPDGTCEWTELCLDLRPGGYGNCVILPVLGCTGFLYCGSGRAAESAEEGKLDIVERAGILRDWQNGQSEESAADKLEEVKASSFDSEQ